MTGPFVGHAISPANTDLDLLAMMAQNARASAAAAGSAAAVVANIVPQPPQGRTVTTLQDYINHTNVFWVKDFGVVGDGVADDTAAMQLALNSAATYKRVLYAGSAIIKISAGLTMAGPGLIFDSAPATAGPGIKVTGAGYVALTITGPCEVLIASVYGAAVACDGVLFANTGVATVQMLRVFGLTNTSCITTTGIVTIFGGSLESVLITPVGFFGFALTIGDLDIEVGPNPVDPTLVRFDTCNIANLVTPTSLLSAATFINCRIDEGNDLLKGMTVLVGCEVTFAAGCTVQAPLLASATRFIGDLDGNGLSVFDDGCVCTGTVVNPGPPTAGTWAKGQRSANLLPAAGTELGWVCTVAGSPGTWVAAVTQAPKLAPGATINGVTFDGTANISLANEYTENTFTPTLTFGGAAVGMTYTTQTGVYSKIGRVVLAQIEIQLSAKGASAGAALISGLPFAAAETFAGAIAFYTAMTGLAGLATLVRVDAGASTIILAHQDADAAPTQLTDANFTNTSRLLISLVYRT